MRDEERDIVWVAFRLLVGHAVFYGLNIVVPVILLPVICNLQHWSRSVSNIKAYEDLPCVDGVVS